MWRLKTWELNHIFFILLLGIKFIFVLFERRSDSILIVNKDEMLSIAARNSHIAFTR